MTASADANFRKLATNTANNNRQGAIRSFIAGLLTLALGLFLLEAGVSLLDDALALAFGIQVLGFVRGVVFLLLALISILIYLLCGATPMIPKRFFVPLALFTPVAELALLPLLTYHYDRVAQITLVISFCQVLFGLSLLFWLQGTLRFRWPAIRQELLGPKAFTWQNLSGFVIVNVLVVLPGIFIYLFLCASLAIDHFSGGFMALRSRGLAVRARTYVRDDNKTVELIPMMHIGEADFYDEISKSLPTNAVILLEGVTDNKNLIKRKLSYHRAAQSLGLVEQHEEFAPVRGRPRPADVDVEQFSQRTIALLNVVSLIHSEGWKAEYLLKLMQESEDPLFAQQLWDDLLTKRNANLLKQIQAELSGSDAIVVPWGAAHMRGIAEEIQKSGFHLTDIQEYQIVHFRSVWNRFFHTKKIISKLEPAPQL